MTRTSEIRRKTRMEKDSVQLWHSSRREHLANFHFILNACGCVHGARVAYKRFFKCDNNATVVDVDNVSRRNDSSTLEIASNKNISR